MRVMPLVSTGFALAVPLVLGAQEPSRSTAEQREAVSITVYNQNFGLVREVRTVDLARGRTPLEFQDVAGQIEPYTVIIRAPGAGPFRVLEQNYQYDLAGADNLLNRYLGQGVNAVMKDGSLQAGTLLSFDHGSLVLSNGNGVTIVSRIEVRDISVGQLPGGLVVKPTLVWGLASDRAAKERAEISYLTDNISWHAEYVAVVNRDDTGLDLNGWVSLDNRSGATYENARLKLVAGDVHRAEDERVPMPQLKSMAVAAEAPQFSERGFFEYHIYTLERPATVADRETKQLALFPTAGARAKKVLIYDGQRSGTDVAVRIEFENTKANDLGMAMPAGKVRVYKEDADGALEFAGEDRVDHTPRDETVRLYLGNAFDVVGERTRVDYRKLSDRSWEETVKVEIRNHKDTPVEVIVVEHLFGDWDIRDNTEKFVKKDAQTVEFTLSVPADGSRSVTYTGRVKR